MARKVKGSGGLLGRLWGRFGEVAGRLGLVKKADVREALEHQEERKVERKPHKKIGRILVEQGKMSGGHVQKVLKEQKKGRPEAKKKAKPKGKKKAPKRAKK